MNMVDIAIENDHRLVGGDWNMFYCSIYWECHHPNSQTHILQRSRRNTTNQKVYRRTWWFLLVRHETSLTRTKLGINEDLEHVLA